MAAKLENPKSHVEQGYDLVADKYLAWSGPRPTTTRMGYIANLVKKLPAGADILELGCGAGVPATQVLIAHEKGFNVTGNDISAAQIALARVHIPKATLIQGDMLALDFRVDSYVHSRAIPLELGFCRLVFIHKTLTSPGWRNQATARQLKRLSPCISCLAACPEAKVCQFSAHPSGTS
ncbi:hypothetical protein DFH08DRAFT_358533 [Mycena albidolilacea]|uniref:Methyltransferase domain-containing protein n=1 Tax=Mycena albidolilacea TaxID=1033008 RepID=A0AAD7AJ82_9AGAR|nr:hypothetical protein DFH08DRAFT_358533 [Mycena albidolilacea]